MDSSHLHIKNTFIEVGDSDEEDDIRSALPRAFSDQSHVRRAPDAALPLPSLIASIPEEGADILVESSPSFQRLDSSELERLRTLSRPGMSAAPVFSFQPIMNPAVIPFTPQLRVPTVGAVPVGDFRWHHESATMGLLEAGNKEFTKLEFEGRLSMVTEASVHFSGVQRYFVLIEEGPVSVADGFGFVFSSSLPCKKNIQKIDSIFLNKKGRICSRVRNELEMLNSSSIGNLDVGSLVELVVDLDALTATFAMFSPPPGIDAATLSILIRDDKNIAAWMTGTATLSIQSILSKTDTGKRAGHFCAVLKNKHTKVRFL